MNDDSIFQKSIFALMPSFYRTKQKEYIYLIINNMNNIQSLNYKSLSIIAF